MSDYLIDINQFTQGLQVLEDSTDAPIGSARKMENIMITDRGGIGPRPGISILGTYDSGATPTDGFYNFLKTGTQIEIPVKASNGILKYYHPTLLDWYQLKSGYTAGKEFGFKEYIISTQNEDYLFGGNTTENYFQWSGATDVTVGTYVSGTTLNVGTVLKSTIFESGTSGVDPLYSSTIGGSPTTTSFQPFGLPAGFLNWVGLFMSMTGGTQNGSVRQIISIDGDGTFHFSALAGAPAIGDSFQVLSSYTDGSNAFITDVTKTWVASQWNAFWIYITSGTLSGKIFLINGSGTHYIQFPSTTAPGSAVTYQIRMAKFPSSGNLTVGTTTVAYSALASSTSFTITDPGVGFAANTAVTVQPTEYPGAPKGNRLENHHNRMVVGNVQSGLSRDSSGNLQGSQSQATAYISNIASAADFTFSNPRNAGQGDIITFPYGGGNIQDIINFENSFAVFKKYAIDLVAYSTTDTTDLPSVTPLKQGYGSINHAIKGRDDIYFVTMDNQITSIGRVQLKDTVPQTTNIGLIIKRLLDTFDFTSVVGHEFAQRIIFSCKRASTDNNNNQLIIYNKQNKSFEGIWYLNANHFDLINGKLYAGDSVSPNVYQLFTSDHNDVRSSTVKFGIDCSWRSNWIHLVPRRSRFRVKPSQFAVMGLNTLGFEGYITDGTIITISVYKDFSDNAELQFNFGVEPTDEEFMQGDNLGAFLGANPLGLAPLGTISAPNPDGQRHFKFIIYFPDIYANYVSIGIDGTGRDQTWEMNRIGLGTEEEAMNSGDMIKSLT